MFLIVGLGNPGLAYAYTRHNAGFMFADYLASYLAFPDFKEKTDLAYTGKVIEGRKVIIMKPQTFMNLSGRAVVKIVSYYKIDSSNIFVVHDDIDLPLFDVRIKFAGSHGGHNGLRDIDSAIGKNYWRIRIGVGRPPSKDQVANYVLSSFNNDDIPKIIDKIFEPISSSINDLLFQESKANIIDKIQIAISGK
ncbi:MAG: aminoacyl-tRNA hydrolase [Holosporales bacterium]|jgi:PTH1 family peptidyl-tRNA hydrolase|nr:aminoacyl-tRNA hydrolase [Holosporales bacterium]